MPNGCGQAADSSSINVFAGAQLYAAAQTLLVWVAHKYLTYTRINPSVVRAVVHCYSQVLAGVCWAVMPTIHSTNKYYKKFYLNNLLLIYRGVVYK